MWLRLETLEVRECPSFTPAQIQHAYGLDYSALDDGSGTYQIPADGAGETVGIAIAYDAPNIANDLNTFSNRYGLPPADFTKVRVGNPGTNTGWAQEATLDVEWVHALAPAASIKLFEGTDNSVGNLLTAVDAARNDPDVSVVSMSWGAGEFLGETANSYQTHFTTPNGHQGVTFVAASGDSGTVSWPAISTNVVGVGGTSLFLSGGDYNYETGWTSSGGGQSAYFPVQDYQAGFTGLSRRSSPDVSNVANPSTGVQVVYNGGTYVFGGTSASAPMFAGEMAIVNEARALLGYGSFDGPNETLPY
jgi:subtilase family serine protease